MGHTPGPWLRESQINSDGSDWILVTKGYKEIVDLRLDEDGVPEREQAANAALIAAAPELLDALRQAVTALNVKERFKVQGTDSYAIAALCDKAIAKAEGRTDAVS